HRAGQRDGGVAAFVLPLRRRADRAVMTTVAPYAPIAALAPYRAGRTAEEVAQEHGLVEAVKRASNDSPFGPLPSVAAALAAAAGSVNRYPDVTAEPLPGA